MQEIEWDGRKWVSKDQAEARIQKLEGELEEERGRTCDTCGDVLHSGPCRDFDPDNGEDWEELPKPVREKIETLESRLEAAGKAAQLIHRAAEATLLVAHEGETLNAQWVSTMAAKIGEIVTGRALTGEGSEPKPGEAGYLRWRKENEAAPSDTLPGPDPCTCPMCGNDLEHVCPDDGNVRPLEHAHAAPSGNQRGDGE